MSTTRYGIFNHETGEDMGGSGGPDYLDTDHKAYCIDIARKIKDQFGVACTVIKLDIEMNDEIFKWWYDKHPEEFSGMGMSTPEYKILDTWNKYKASLAEPVDSYLYGIGDTVEIIDGNAFIGTTCTVVRISRQKIISYELAFLPNNWWPHSQLKLIKRKEVKK